ncbi:MAG: hypothetical protein H6R17_901 [Proteobacteria bacterium]|nr:hypothetical protein [Pseudomonadota bacterium]
MDISSVGSISAAVSQAQTGDAVGIAVLKKAIDLQAQGALQLIESLPQPATNSPPNLGQGVNTFA